MAYVNRFVATDDLITHLNAAVVGVVTDPTILSTYAGFLAVSAVTVYELAIKDIFEEFARKKHNTFGNFIQTHFSHINGRIKIDSLRKEHIKTFGAHYVLRFNRDLDSREIAVFAINHVSIKNCYANLINCRHSFVHQGTHTSTLPEVILNYQQGKEIIHCLGRSMRR